MENEQELRDQISAMPYTYEVTAKAKQIKDDYSKMEGKKVSVAGRVLAVRKAGKLVFIDIQDSSGKIQAYFEFVALGEEKFNAAKAFNPGDIIGVEGTVFKTTPGEVSVKVIKHQQLAKAIRPLPDKWHGLQNTELRYRKRYLDLIMNPEVRDIFIKRTKIIRTIQKFLDEKGFIEFETPAIQPIYGGAEAKPFATKVNSLNEEHYLKIADELYLKRLIIGGFERVYEIGKDFRNEDLDTTHNPEFTMLEWYMAYADYNELMKMVEELYTLLAKEIIGATTFTYQGHKINLKQPWQKLSAVEVINQKVGKDILTLGDSEIIEIAEKHGIRFEKHKRTRVHAYKKLIETIVEPMAIQPTFIMDYPRETSGLTRPKRGNPKLVERFEFFIAGTECGNAYSELQNPFIQRENFEATAKRLKAGDDEAEPFDEDFIEAMEYGMPPTAGIGIGIDRLVMLFTDKASIKEVILFPMEKRGEKK